MYLEAVAMLPQIYMFQKQASDQGGIVEVRKYWSEKIRKVNLNQIMESLITSAASVRADLSSSYHLLWLIDRSPYLINKFISSLFPSFSLILFLFFRSSLLPLSCLILHIYSSSLPLGSDWPYCIRTWIFSCFRAYFLARIIQVETDDRL